MSFVDSLSHFIRFLSRPLNIDTRRDDVYASVTFAFLYSIFVKYASSFAIAFWLSKIPPVFQSMRHFLTFCVAGVTAMLLIPNRHRMVLATPNHPSQVILSIFRGLYKLRKLQFIVLNSIDGGHNILPTIFFGFICIEFSGLIHRSERILESSNESLSTLLRSLPFGLIRICLSFKVLLTISATIVLFYAQKRASTYSHYVKLSIESSNANECSIAEESLGIHNEYVVTIMKVFGLGLLLLRYNCDSLFNPVYPPELTSEEMNDTWIPSWWKRDDLIECAMNDMKMNVDLIFNRMRNNMKAVVEDVKTWILNSGSSVSAGSGKTDSANNANADIKSEIMSKVKAMILTKLNKRTSMMFVMFILSLVPIKYIGVFGTRALCVLLFVNIMNEERKMGRRAYYDRVMGGIVLGAWNMIEDAGKISQASSISPFYFMIKIVFVGWCVSPDIYHRNGGRLVLLFKEKGSDISQFINLILQSGSMISLPPADDTDDDTVSPSSSSSKSTTTSTIATTKSKIKFSEGGASVATTTKTATSSSTSSVPNPPANKRSSTS